MEDDYQIALKSKIAILFQFEKYQDVIQLSEQYNEKYGKDMEVDMMRFKSERQLGKIAAIPDIEAEGEPPLLLPADHEAMENPAMLVINEIPAADQSPLLEEKLDAEPFPETNELLITDTFAQNEPVFSLAHNEPPVTLIDSGEAENVQIQTASLVEEMAVVEENPGELVNTKDAFDFKSDPVMAFDADPRWPPRPKANRLPGK